MAFARLALFPGGTAEHYTALTDEIGDAGTEPPGRVLFTCGLAPGGWQTVQVWTSFAALQTFDTEVFLPALARLGGAAFPEVPQVVDFETTDLELAAH